MVCIYCGGRTQVTNSRAQKQVNQVWRRRQCVACRATFTTHEAAELSSGLVVQYADQQLTPFSRERLFASIYDSCKHRSDAVADAAALTQTVTGKLLTMHDSGMVIRNDIVAITYEVLHRFNPAAATIYKAYHPAQ